jgi:hypothetical protein
MKQAADKRFFLLDEKESNYDKCSRWFVASAGVILLVTGLAKIISTFGSAAYLKVHDPIFDIPFRYLMSGSGYLELIIAFVSLRSPGKERLQLWMISWMSSCIVIYRFGLYWINYQRPCHCFGSLTELLRIPDPIASFIIQAIAVYLFVGSVGILLIKWVARKSKGRKEGFQNEM